MSFTEAIQSGFDNYVNFKGRASRPAFWWWTLFSFLVFAVALIIDNVVFGTLVLYYIAALGLLLPNLSVAVRRLHDTDRSGWWLLIYFVPFIGGIVLLVFYLQKSDPGQNRFDAAAGAPQAAGGKIPPPPPPKS